ncbi:MAG: glucose-1-phosphate cytidylyltransferase [Bacteroidetes bacterium]|nr:glucose-1-phosphate cytidylyltransferase [Bacteroidota bacterium]
MKCLILCGGRGVIDPITRHRVPKCLLKVGNRPLIWHVMKLFSSYGYNDFVLALGQEGDQIKQYFMNGFELLHDIEVNLAGNEVKSLNRIPEENWTIKLVDTGNSACTGARIARCERYLKYEPFFIAYSDVLADVNITDLVRFHQASKKLLTVTGVNPPSRFGTFYMNEPDTLTYNPHAKLEMHKSRINGGFMVANEKLFEKLSPISECNLETEIFNTLITEQQIALWKHDGFWQNVDTERDMDYLQRLYEINKRPWLGIN